MFFAFFSSFQSKLDSDAVIIKTHEISRTQAVRNFIYSYIGNSHEVNYENIFKAPTKKLVDSFFRATMESAGLQNGLFFDNGLMVNLKTSQISFVDHAGGPMKVKIDLNFKNFKCTGCNRRMNGLGIGTRVQLEAGHQPKSLYCSEACYSRQVQCPRTWIKTLMAVTDTTQDIEQETMQQAFQPLVERLHKYDRMRKDKYLTTEFFYNYGITEAQANEKTRNDAGDIIEFTGMDRCMAAYYYANLAEEADTDLVKVWYNNLSNNLDSLHAMREKYKTSPVFRKFFFDYRDTERFDTIRDIFLSLLEEHVLKHRDLLEMYPSELEMFLYSSLAISQLAIITFTVDENHALPGEEDVMMEPVQRFGTSDFPLFKVELWPENVDNNIGSLARAEQRKRKREDATEAARRVIRESRNRLNSAVEEAARDAFSA